MKICQSISYSHRVVKTEVTILLEQRKLHSLLML
nr:MAG TPA: hypothetical protein [Caudoviricetes sp.]